jgi:hypothetical protein
LPRPRSASAEIALFCAISPLLLILAHFMGGGGYQSIEPYPESAAGRHGERGGALRR